MLGLNNNIQDFYESNDEDLRLKRTGVKNIEFLITLKYLEKISTNKSRILDACAATGVYAFYLASKGYDVTARDLVECNVEHIYW